MKYDIHDKVGSFAYYPIHKLNFLLYYNILTLNPLSTLVCQSGYGIISDEEITNISINSGCYGALL